MTCEKDHTALPQQLLDSGISSRSSVEVGLWCLGFRCSRTAQESSLPWRLLIEQLTAELQRPRGNCVSGPRFAARIEDVGQMKGAFVGW